MHVGQNFKTRGVLHAQGTNRAGFMAGAPGGSRTSFVRQCRISPGGQRRFVTHSLHEAQR
jgi:hypothetical protein